jgi:hypothetical protein
MTNIMDRGDKHLRIRKRKGEDEIYYILCLEEKDYAEFIDDCLIIYMDASEDKILEHFKELGFDIRMKKQESEIKVGIEQSKKDLKEVQSIIA